MVSPISPNFLLHWSLSIFSNIHTPFQNNDYVRSRSFYSIMFKCRNRSNALQQDQWISNQRGLIHNVHFSRHTKTNDLYCPLARRAVTQECTSWLHCRYKIHILWPKLDLPPSPCNNAWTECNHGRNRASVFCCTCHSVFISNVLKKQQSKC